MIRLMNIIPAMTSGTFRVIHKVPALIPFLKPVKRCENTGVFETVAHGIIGNDHRRRGVTMAQ
jgi:hypothetical protein